jgi:hypothetical protein
MLIDLAVGSWGDYNNIVTLTIYHNGSDAGGDTLLYNHIIRFHAVALKGLYQIFAKDIAAHHAEHNHLTLQSAGPHCLVSTFAPGEDSKFQGLDGLTLSGESVDLHNKVHIDAADNCDLIHLVS